jgi:quercetin 2,3-dioxygenase
MTHRSEISVLKAPPGGKSPGFETFDLTRQTPGISIDPFLVVSLFSMSQPIFPPHPHAGFSVATYVLPESEIGFWNQDTQGNRNIILPGSLHWTIAGSGLQHEETVTRSGRAALGFQIWIDHAAADRQMPPAGVHVKSEDVPVFDVKGIHARVLVGESQGLISPINPPTKVRLVEVTLAPNTTFTQALDDGENAFMWVIDGNVIANSETGSEKAVAGEIMIGGTSGPSLRLHSGDHDTRFMLFAGKPFRHDVVQGGPMVASTQAELATFMSRFRSGSMGHLKAFDQAALDAEFDAQ